MCENQEKKINICEKLEIIILKILIFKEIGKCEKTYLKRFKSCGAWSLCKILSYDLKIDNTFTILINSDLNIQNGNECFNVTTE